MCRAHFVLFYMSYKAILFSLYLTVPTSTAYACRETYFYAAYDAVNLKTSKNSAIHG